MKIQLSDHFTYGKLIRFTIPSIAMMIFTSIYGVVDGFFVSNFAGKNAIFGGQPDNAVFDDSGDGRLYVRNGRHSNSRQNLR